MNEILNDALGNGENGGIKIIHKVEFNALNVIGTLSIVLFVFFILSLIKSKA